MSDTAIARPAPRTISLPTPAELTQALELARALKDAAGLLPSYIRKEGEILAIVLAGRELGLPPMVSLREIVLVQGKVQLSAQLVLSIMKRDGIRVEWMTPSDNERKQTLRLQEGGRRPYDSTFTIDMAKRAGLIRGGGGCNWTKWPAQMLRARAITNGARAYCPESIIGVYSPDEAAEFSPAPVHGPQHIADPVDEADVVDAEVIDDAPEPPVREHHATWDDARKAFCAELGRLGTTYAAVAAGCEKRGMPRPSEMDDRERGELLVRIRAKQGGA